MRCWWMVSIRAMLAYNVVETNGNTNLSCQSGSLLFWFKPNGAAPMSEEMAPVTGAG